MIQNVEKKVLAVQVVNDQGDDMKDTEKKVEKKITDAASQWGFKSKESCHENAKFFGDTAKLLQKAVNSMAKDGKYSAAQVDAVTILQKSSESMSAAYRILESKATSK